MQPGTPASGACVRCGAPNPPLATVCGYCGNSLQVPSPATGALPAPRPDTFRLVTTSQDNPSAGGLILLILGIIICLTGIGLLVGAVVVHQGVQTFNNACAQNPLCTPEPDPSGAMTAGGIVLLIVGLILAYYGYVRLNG